MQEEPDRIPGEMKIRKSGIFCEKDHYLSECPTEEI
jgi:hypothetical protein